MKLCTPRLTEVVLPSGHTVGPPEFDGCGVFSWATLVLWEAGVNAEGEGQTLMGAKTCGEERAAFSQGAGLAPVKGEMGERKMVEREPQAAVRVQGSLVRAKVFCGGAPRWAERPCPGSPLSVPAVQRRARWQSSYHSHTGFSLFYSFKEHLGLWALGQGLMCTLSKYYLSESSHSPFWADTVVSPILQRRKQSPEGLSDLSEVSQPVRSAPEAGLQPLSPTASPPMAKALATFSLHSSLAQELRASAGSRKGPAGEVRCVARSQTLLKLLPSSLKASHLKDFADLFLLPRALFPPSWLVPLSAITPPTLLLDPGI